jgi:Transglutaminase-like superfamily
MKSLRRFSRLSSIERRLLLKTALLLVVIRLGLWLLPFETLRRLLIGFSEGPARLRDTDQSSVGEVTWAVEKACRFIPRAATCLSLALTAQVLLLRRGHGAVVHIGVAKGDAKEFLAHAWVESEGRIVIGDHELDRYTLLTRLGGNGARRPSVRSPSVSRVK